MGWQIGESKPRHRHFHTGPSVDPDILLPKWRKNSGERQAKGKANPPSVIVPGSPEDPCRDLHLSFARVIETAQRFPEAFQAIREALAEMRKESQ